MKRCFLACWTVCLWMILPFAVRAASYPVTVQSCGEPITIMHHPHRAVIQDVNMAEMAFALHLQPDIAGLSGISGWNKPTAGFLARQENIPEIATHYPALEQILAARADIFIAGWNYGMHIGGDVTPETLRTWNIPTLVLTESCIHGGGIHPQPTLDLLYNDELRLGRVFDRLPEAQALIAGWKERVLAVKRRLSGVRPLRVFLYDSGLDRPFTAGRYALASELIREGGGINIFDDLPTNWGAAAWETAALRDPDAIILLDYGSGIEKSRDILAHNPLIATSRAFRTMRELSLRYDELTPAPADIDSIEKIARFLHPERYP